MIYFYIDGSSVIQKIINTHTYTNKNNAHVRARWVLIWKKKEPNVHTCIIVSEEVRLLEATFQVGNKIVTSQEISSSKFNRPNWSERN